MEGQVYSFRIAFTTALEKGAEETFALILTDRRRVAENMKQTDKTMQTAARSSGPGSLEL